MSPPWKFGFRNATGDGCRFIILFPGRTGSSWLVSALSGHSDIQVKGEILVGMKPKAQHRELLDIYGKPPRSGTARGFKTKLKDVAEKPELARLINDHGIKVIHMARKDLLKLAVSRINARRLKDQVGQWNRVDKTERLPAFEIDVETMEASLQACHDAVQELERFMEDVSTPVLELEYDDMLGDPSAYINRVLDFIEVGRCDLESAVRKNTDDDLSKVILNYSELRRSMADGRWGFCFTDFPR